MARNHNAYWLSSFVLFLFTYREHSLFLLLLRKGQGSYRRLLIKCFEKSSSYPYNPFGHSPITPKIIIRKPFLV